MKAAVMHLAESIVSNIHFAAIAPQWIYMFVMKYGLLVAVLR